MGYFSNFQKKQFIPQFIIFRLLLRLGCGISQSYFKIFYDFFKCFSKFGPNSYRLTVAAQNLASSPHTFWKILNQHNVSYNSIGKAWVRWHKKFSNYSQILPIDILRNDAINEKLKNLTLQDFWTYFLSIIHHRFPDNSWWSTCSGPGVSGSATQGK